MSTQNSFYDRFFGKGGWKYDRATEREFMRRFVIPLGGWQKGQRVVEVGAGQCVHADILRELGFNVTAVEASSSGVENAKTQFPKLDVVEADVSTWSPSAPVDHVFVRGMSFYHYELTKNRHGVDVAAQTKRMFGWIRRRGTFVLQIVTDFSGRRPLKGVHMNRLSDYLGLFEPLGKVVGVTDWNGTPLNGRARPSRTDRGILIATEKL